SLLSRFDLSSVLPYISLLLSPRPPFALRHTSPLVLLSFSPQATSSGLSSRSPSRAVLPSLLSLPASCTPATSLSDTSSVLLASLLLPLPHPRRVFSLLSHLLSPPPRSSSPTHAHPTPPRSLPTQSGIPSPSPAHPLSLSTPSFRLSNTGPHPHS